MVSSRVGWRPGGMHGVTGLLVRSRGPGGSSTKNPCPVYDVSNPAACFQSEIFVLWWECVGKEDDLMGNCETDSKRRERVAAVMRRFQRMADSMLTSSVQSSRAQMGRSSSSTATAGEGSKPRAGQSSDATAGHRAMTKQNTTHNETGASTNSTQLNAQFTRIHS